MSAAALLIMAFVGFSRIFMGGHYLTDILAGYAVGIAWSGLAYMLIEKYFQQRRIEMSKKNKSYPCQIDRQPWRRKSRGNGQKPEAGPRLFGEPGYQG